MLAGAARVTLAGIRIFNGAGGLLVPGMMARQLKVEGEAAGPMAYPFRMFGIRTILIGADLLARDRAVRRHAVRAAIVVHASDTVCAAMAAKTNALPRRAAQMATAISAVNLALALLANRRG
jgi:hypothetical protein